MNCTTTRASFSSNDELSLTPPLPNDRQEELLVRLEELLGAANPGEGFAEYEARSMQVMTELTRLVLERHLQRLAAAEPARIELEGCAWRRHMLGTVTYHSLCGPLSVARYTYRPCNERNGATIVPLEVHARILARCTPALANGIALAFAKGPLRSYEEDLIAAYRKPPSRSTMERVAMALGSEIADWTTRIEPDLRSQEQLPDSAHAISIGLDRTTIPMAEPRPDGGEPTTRRKRRRKPYLRTPPPPVDVHYRMAYVGTLAIVDRDGHAVSTRRYVATAEEGPDGIIERLMADLSHLRVERHLPVVVVQDGAAELWGLMWSALDAAGIKRGDRIEVVDRYHVVEHLAAVLDIVEPDKRRRHAQLAEWNDALDRRDGAINRISRTITNWTYRAPRRVRERLMSHDGYLDVVAQSGRGRYAWLRRNGYPQASGITEGACKSLVCARAKRSGQRWCVEGVTSALSMRALHQSDRLRRFLVRMQDVLPAEVRCAM